MQAPSFVGDPLLIGAQPILGHFAQDPDRLSRFCVDVGGLHGDFSKHAIDAPNLAALFAFARALGLETARTRLFGGDIVNVTEARPALHTALRAPSADQHSPHHAQIVENRVHCRQFALGIRNGTICASDGGAFTHILHLGIGGSDLGPRLLADCLSETVAPELEIRFCANCEAGDFARAIHGLDPRRTLVFFVSKSFGTLETLLNAQSAKAWLGQALSEAQIGDHLAAASANVAAAREWGFRADRLFPFWAWVGGRYSIWSSGSLSIEIAFGSDAFDAFLAGAHDMDTHFVSQQLEHNLPVLAGLIEYWNAFALRRPTRCVAVYAKALERLPFYLQQLEMESLGKVARFDNQPALPAPIVWGGEGTLVQHSFFQRLHQAQDSVPMDFVAVATDPHQRPDHTRMILANAIAQAQAFLVGRSLDEARHELAQAGRTGHEIDQLAPHLVCPGNRGSSFYLFDALTPENLGAFVAFQEHKTYVLSVLMGVNAFDQFGVELGKSLAKQSSAALQSGDVSGFDPSSADLLQRIRHLQAQAG